MSTLLKDICDFISLFSLAINFWAAQFFVAGRLTITRKEATRNSPDQNKISNSFAHHL